MGVGVSGGEAGARYGPSIMPGGSKEDYERVGPMLQSLAAKVDEQPCVAWLGNGSAGHYVKMVHNGIEYGLMQLIAETYHVLKVAGGLTNDELNLVFSTWNKGVLHSFLLEITTGIFVYKDEETGNRLLDMILDTAHQKGTGAWTSTSAMNLSVPIPTIDIAVTMRNISALKKQRELAEQQFGAVARTTTNHKKQLIDNMEQALYFASIVTYAQGMALLTTASQRYGYGLQLAEVAKIWRGGCIIRAALLEKIKAAYGTQPELSNLLMNDSIAAELNGAENGIRKAITTAVESSIPVPALMASLGYFDAFRSAWLPANLVQAQRDFFGAHKYERTDKTGEFHTDWTHKTNGHGDK
jgi:6-phosphogluconate dehydrogenase